MIHRITRSLFEAACVGKGKLTEQNWRKKGGGFFIPMRPGKNFNTHLFLGRDSCVFGTGGGALRVSPITEEEKKKKKKLC